MIIWPLLLLGAALLSSSDSSSDLGSTSRRKTAGIVVVYRGKILLVHPTSAPPIGTWSIPKGGIDPGEDEWAAARRETAEESGIVIAPDSPRTGPYRITGPYSDLAAFLVILDDRKPMPPIRTIDLHEVDEAKFVDFDRARSLIDPWMEPLLRRIVEISLLQVTDEVLDEMQATGWYPVGQRQRSGGRPIAWDINCGSCEEWARLAVKRVGGKAYWLDQIMNVDPEEVSHCVLVLGGRFYDAQNPEGVDSIHDLDVARHVSREEYAVKSPPRYGADPKEDRCPQDETTGVFEAFNIDKISDKQRFYEMYEGVAFCPYTMAQREAFEKGDLICPVGHHGPFSFIEPTTVFRVIRSVQPSNLPGESRALVTLGDPDTGDADSSEAFLMCFAEDKDEKGNDRECKRYFWFPHQFFGVEY